MWWRVLEITRNWDFPGSGEGAGGLPSSAVCSPQIPIAVSGVRGMGFLMRYHIETGGGQLPAKLSSLFVKVSGGQARV